jgi:antitoxin component YwqK of YwqJK toxin-antitoxin module
MKIKNACLAIIALIGVLSTAYAQEKTNQFDAKGKKEGLWKGFFEESKRLRYEGTFQNGVEVGTFRYYDNTKAQSLLATRIFSDKGTTAQTTFFDQKNNKVSEGTTVNRLKEGIWNYYHKAVPQIMAVESYKNGKLEGIRTVYFITGEIAEESTYKIGLKEGIYKIYLENGTVIEEAIFKNNEYNGPAIYRESSGKIASKGAFVKNEKKGIWEFYKDGKLVKKESYPLRLKFAKKSNIPKQ